MSSSEYQINLMKSAIKKNSKLLKSNIKRIIGIIVKLLKDRLVLIIFQLVRGLELKNLSKNNMYSGLYSKLYI
jgi:hypothetical protein